MANSLKDAEKYSDIVTIDRKVLKKLHRALVMKVLHGVPQNVEKSKIQNCRA